MGEQEQTKPYEVSYNFDKNLGQYLFSKYISINSDKEYIYELQYFKQEMDYLYEIDEDGTKELLVYLLKNVYEVLKFNQKKGTLSNEEQVFLDNLDRVTNLDEAFSIAFFDEEDLFLMKILEYFSLSVSDIVSIKNNAKNINEKTFISMYNSPLNIFSNFVYASNNLIFSKDYNKKEYKNIYLEFMSKYKESKDTITEKYQNSKEILLEEYQDSEEKVLDRYTDVIRGLSIYNKQNYEKLLIDICREYILKNNSNTYTETLKNLIEKNNNKEIIEFLSEDKNREILKILLKDFNLDYDQNKKEQVSNKSNQRVVNKLLLHHNRSKKTFIDSKEKPNVLEIESNKKRIGKTIVNSFVKIDDNDETITNNEAFGQFMIDLYNQDETQYEMVFASLINDVYKVLEYSSLYDDISEYDKELLFLIDETDDINVLYNYILENVEYIETLLINMDLYYNEDNFAAEVFSENYFNQIDLNYTITSADTLGVIEKLNYANEGFLFSKEYVKEEYLQLYNNIRKKKPKSSKEEIESFYCHIIEDIQFIDIGLYHQLMMDICIEYYTQIKLMNEDEKTVLESHIINLIETLPFGQLMEVLDENNDFLFEMIVRYSKYSLYSSDQRSLTKLNLINEKEKKTMIKLYKAKRNNKRES